MRIRAILACAICALAADVPGAQRAPTFRTEARLVVLHAFVKKTQRTPRPAMDLALKRLKEAGL